MRRRRFSAVVAVLSVLALLPFGAASVAAAPDPSGMYVQAISYGGPGCPQGTVGQSISNDRTTFTLIFDSFVASIGPGIAITESRKTCQVNVTMHVPNGWQFAVTSVAYRGYVQLAAGQYAEQKTVYRVGWGFARASAATRFTGPVSKDYLLADNVVAASLVWSPCGATFPVSIDAQVRVFGTNASNGQMTTDSIDGKVKNLFGLQWRQCS